MGCINQEYNAILKGAVYLGILGFLLFDRSKGGGSDKDSPV